MSLNRLSAAAVKATMPTTIGTILALKSHRIANASAVPISTIMNMVNSCEGWKRGPWKLPSIRRTPPWCRMSCRNGRTKPMTDRMRSSATIGRSIQLSP
jgi:hypothetical protein